MKFAICTLGCKVNTCEAASYGYALRQAGYTEVPFEALADIYIINTCAVTNTAAAKSRKKVHQAIKQNPQAVICVVGCLVQIGDRRLEADPAVDILIGSAHKDELPDLIRAVLNDHQRHDVRTDVANAPCFEDLRLDVFHQHTRAFLKIQDGCNQFCSYCIIPYARGRERSLDPESVMRNARILHDNGHQEIVLSGIHTGRYGRGTKVDLTGLLKQLLTIGFARIRISSIELNEITDELLALMAANSVMAHHLHIPLQSGSDRILELMRRPYDRTTFAARVAKIKSVIPDIAISTDIIVGFPTETAADFQATLDLAREVGFSFLHVFPYSPRKGTPAATMPQVPAETKKSRTAQLLAASVELYDSYKQGFIGHVVPVLFETVKQGYYLGHNGQYVPIRVKSVYDIRHKMYNVNVTELRDHELYGTLQEESQ